MGRPLDVQTLALFYEEEVRAGTELVLFDYGGMSIGNSLLEDNSRRLVQWAVDHSSALVVVLTWMTYSLGIRRELEEHGLVVANQDRNAEEIYGADVEGDVLPNVVDGSTSLSTSDDDNPIPTWWTAGLR